MSEEKTGSSMFRGLLRRVQRGKSGAHALSDDHELWNSYEDLTKSSREVAEHSQKITSQLVRKRALLDGIFDRLRSAKERSGDVALNVSGLVAILDRLSVLALNTGLEGARVGEGAGLALIRVADECKGHVDRGVEQADELKSTLEKQSADLTHLGEDLERARQEVQTLIADAARIGTSASRTESLLDDMKDRLRKSTGMDSDTLKSLSEATEHARALVSALGTLSGKVPEGLLAATLRPVAEPLLRLLATEEGDDE
jgi:methyl-accepting chemotaxis protein